MPDAAQPARSPRAISAIVLGAGARDNVYGNFALAYPDHLSIAGVAEPSALRREGDAERHGIETSNQYSDWHDVFGRPKFADAIVVSTPDHLHVAPCMAALDAGYDLPLEKPIALTDAECRTRLARARECGRTVAWCHVLRYAQYSVHMRNLIRSG